MTDSVDASELRDRVRTEKNVDRAAKAVEAELRELDTPMTRARCYVLARAAVQAVQVEPPKKPAAPVQSMTLTPRRLQILKLCARGLTGPEISEELEVSIDTVRTHMRLMFAHLGVRTRAQ